METKIYKADAERACENIIETILFCLPNAYKGTVYEIGPPPYMIAKRITSGIIDEERKTISWGLPEWSDYNPPGKPWIEYRDEPGRPLEAMAWCVENQKNWTAEDPRNDTRSVRLQVESVWEDSHHLAAYDKMPESLKKEWTDLLYRDTGKLDAQFLDRSIQILEDPSLNLPYQEKSRKSLSYLKTLAEIMGELEGNTNLLLQQVLNGSRGAA